MKKQNLESSNRESLIVSVGRFNPPTKGHSIIFKKIKSLSNILDADHIILPTKSQDSKKNPLFFKEKIKILKHLYQDINFEEDESITDIFKLLNKYGIEHGYKHLYIVLGDDRGEEVLSRIKKYNYKEYFFDTIEGEILVRNNQENRDSIWSASMVRDLVSKNDFKGFSEGIDSSDIEFKKSLFDLLKERMGL